MYLDYFGLKEKPFNITPNPQFIFLSKNHKEVFAHLLYGLENRCGFIEITGEVGAGKTTVLRTLFEQLEEQEFRLAFIFNPALSADELLLEVCREYGIEVGQSRGAQLLPLINRFLLDENASGRTVVLVIDEAQNLAVPVLEQIRMLSNLETETDKLIQIVLVGQPELGDLLSRSNLRQLNQRISVRYHLQPMDAADSSTYLNHRLKVAGAEKPLFTDAALRLLYKHSSGLPRLLNILADRALLAAYSDDRMLVDKQEVKTVIRELKRGDGIASMPRLVTAPVTACLFFILLAVVSWSLYSSHDPQPSLENPPAKVVDQQRGADYRSVQDLRAALAASGETVSFRSASRALAETWHAEFIERLPSQYTSSDYVEALQQAGWQWSSFSGDLGRLTSIDTPVLLELVLPGVSGRRYLAVTAARGDFFSIAPAINGRSSLHYRELQAIFSGRAFFLWNNYLDIGTYATVGAAAADIREIQAMLNRVVGAELSLTGIYDRTTLEAVTRFQAQTGIIQDGRVGPLTLMLLYKQSGSYNPPRLKGRGTS